MNFGLFVQQVRNNKILDKLTHPIAMICRFALSQYTKVHPSSYPNHYHRWSYGRKLNLKTPQSLHEKIFWMLYNSDTSAWSKLADKVAVRDYVKQVGLEHILNEVYKIYDHIPDCDTLFQNLPSSFVIKVNHCGGGKGIFIIKDKQSINKKSIYKKLKKAFHDPYGKRTGQLHYSHIKPQILIEKYLTNEIDEYQVLPDFKFFCFHGVPQLINSIGNRNLEEHTAIDHYYTLDWQRIQWNKEDKSENLIRPKSLNQMIEYAKILSRPFAFVRVDFYECNGNPVFGEMTFTPGFDEFCGTYGDKVLKLGERIDLSSHHQTYDL